MPYTVDISFDQFFSAINLSGDHRSTANARKDRIVKLLEKDFEIIDSFSTGSIPRFTALTGHADVDVLVVLHWTKHIKDRKPSAVLGSVQRALSGKATSVRRNGQAVTLKYESWPNVDIVPAVRYPNDDGGVRYYEIPDMHREQWIRTLPRKHSSDVEAKSSECGDKFRKVIKMLKWWNHQHSGLLQSYHVEVMALKTFSGAMGSFSWELTKFFDAAHTLIQSSLWHEGGQADAYLDWNQRNEATKRIASAKADASAAWYATYGSNSDHKRAIDLYRKMFGGKFPAYG